LDDSEEDEERMRVKEKKNANNSLSIEGGRREIT